jgi:hypothetical protein
MTSTPTTSKARTRRPASHREPLPPPTLAEIAETTDPFPGLAPHKSVVEWVAEFRAAYARCHEADVALASFSSRARRISAMVSLETRCARPGSIRLKLTG